MPSSQRPLLKATLTVVGTIIGAGIFGLPAVFSRLGVVVGSLLFLAVFAVVLATHLLLVDVFLAERERRRLPGIARERLGPWGGWLAAIAYPGQIIGGNVAYLILGGRFLDALFRTFGWYLPQDTLSILFWLGGALTIFFGLRAVARVESLATWALLAMGLLVSAGAWHGLLDLSPAVVGVSDIILGFGVFLFALSGFTVIGDAVELCGRRRQRSLVAISLGTLVAAVVSWIFGVAIYSATGAAAVTDTLAFVQLLPVALAWTVPVFGFLAVSTSLLTTLQDLRTSLRTDFGCDDGIAFTVAVGSPLAIHLLTHSSVLSTLAFVGAVFIGVNGFLIAACASDLARRSQRLMSQAVAGIIAAAFVTGALVSLIQTIV